MADRSVADLLGSLPRDSSDLPDRLSALDAAQLAETLVLATEGGSTVHPDPIVGCVIHGNGGGGGVLGRGHHVMPGGLHAEPIALAEAGARARGATLYCNLEPCGYDAPPKRQPPCTRAIIEAGISRVVVGQIDPHPRVRGSGVQALVIAGVKVDITSDPVPYWLANPVYNTVLWLGRPFVHVASSTGSRNMGSVPLVFEYEVEPGALRDVPPEARSVLVRVDDPSRVDLPTGWQADAIDGVPAPSWVAALRRVAASATS